VAGGNEDLLLIGGQDDVHGRGLLDKTKVLLRDAAEAGVEWE